MKTCRLLLAALVLLCTTAVMGEEQERNGIPYVKLNNGEWMPRFGIGTYNVPGDSVAEDYPHGYGTGGNSSVWGDAFDNFLAPIMRNNTTGINATQAATKTTPQAIYTLGGVKVVPSDSLKGVYIVKTATGTQKVVL